MSLIAHEVRDCCWHPLFNRGPHMQDKRWRWAQRYKFSVSIWRIVESEWKQGNIKPRDYNENVWTVTALFSEFILKEVQRFCYIINCKSAPSCNWLRMRSLCTTDGCYPNPTLATSPSILSSAVIGHKMGHTHSGIAAPTPPPPIPAYCVHRSKAQSSETLRTPHSLINITKHNSKQYEHSSAMMQLVELWSRNSTDPGSIVTTDATRTKSAHSPCDSMGFLWRHWFPPPPPISPNYRSVN